MYTEGTLIYTGEQAQQATGRKEAVGLLHKAAKLKNKFDSYKM